MPAPAAAMTRARYSIGIDLGTTNSALAFVALDGDGVGEILAIPQIESAVAIVDAPTLPSFFYLPEPTLPAAAEGSADERWMIGRFARSKAAESPGRVVHSAKSWLAHHRADREAAFLPWASEDVGAHEKISPVRAAALILRYLRDAWDDRFAAAGAPFDEQLVTITVPASFDAVAQRLTIVAAEYAGYPRSVRLLEEPQAALYRWLDVNAATPETWPITRAGGADCGHVLVVDIGGGTSDFSLFAFRSARASDAQITRIAVSDHILLGGDNMDLALAHRLEPQLADDEEALSGRQWAYLVARSRDLKESALGTDGAPGEVFSVSMPGRGSHLIAQARSAQLSRAEIEGLLLDGFFPACGAGEYPLRAKAALRELGLPYARDPAVTRHLADFLRDRPAVDAVLFNGGALHPPRVRERIRTQIGVWQSGAVPAVLDNADPELAVARGAARFGALVHARAARIEAGTAHAVFLHMDRAQTARIGESDERNAAGESALVCVLPHGASTEHTYTISQLPLRLRLNAPVRFAPFSSARHQTVPAGTIVAWNDHDFHALPPLETTIDVAGDSAGRTDDANRAATVPVQLRTRLTEVGRLDIACVSTDAAQAGEWPLEFNLRAHLADGDRRNESAAGDSGNGAGPNATPAAIEAAHKRMATLFGRPLDRRDRLTATRLIKSLETIVARPKSEWNVVLVRSLWTTLARSLPDRERSVEHEEAWLILAGFLLRPGFGAAMDDARINALWTVHETGPAFAAKSVDIQTFVLWRRVGGGLSRERQHAVLAPHRPTLDERTNAPPELILLAGSLERLAVATKSELVERFITIATQLERDGKHNAHVLAALGLLLNRAPSYGGPETVVGPELVERTFHALNDFNWDGPRRMELQTLFVRAARVVDNRGIDVARPVRRRIADRLERAGVPPAKTAPLKDFMPLRRAERAGTFGESLPPGLILSGTPHENG